MVSYKVREITPNTVKVIVKAILAQVNVTRKQIWTYFYVYISTKNKMQIIFDVFICFKQNHIVLNMNPLHITCIFIKPSQALFA